MNTVVEINQSRELVPDTGRKSVAEVLRHVTAVQEVMRTVMKPEVHYGRIPGTDKPTLLKQGAETLCLAFNIADDYRIEDLSTADTARYRVVCVGIHQPTGMVLGQGMGECSSGEEKYRWRKAVCKEEFEATPPNLRRVKYGKKGGGGFYTVEQVRTEPADVANTVLKMAGKRAKIAMTLNVTAASDMFGQDLEDLDAALREHLTGDEAVEHADRVRSEWCAKAEAATTTEALTAVMKAGVKVFQEARDPEGYAQFASAVQKRGAAIKAGGKTAAPAPAAAPPGPPPVDDPFVQAINEAEERDRG